LRGQRQATWRFLDTGYADPFFNMAVDEAIAIMGRQGWPPTVRVYGWRPAAISIGYSQRIQEALDLKRCARLGIPLVRRITGGRAVLHNEEVTYSVIATREHLGSGNSVLEVYWPSPGLIPEVPGCPGLSAAHDTSRWPQESGSRSNALFHQLGPI
jgi:hypothetical protein